MNLKKTHELQSVLNLIVKSVTEMLPADGGASIILWDTEQEKFTTSASTVANQPSDTLARRVRSSGGVTRWIIDNREPYVVTNTRDEDNNSIVDEYGVKAYVGVPLLVGSEEAAVGVLYALSLTPREYSERDLSLLQEFASVAAVTIDNTRLSEQLQLANHELQAYAHTVAHDLKTPLSTVIGYMNLINMEFDDIPEDDTRGYLLTVEDMIGKMFTIIDELLILAELREEKEFGLHAIDNRPIVIDSVKRLRSLVKERDAEISMPDKWPLALGRETWVEEIWTNFISNAIKYGGNPPQVELGVDEDPETGMVRFWVRDNGTGLSPEEREQLFTQFERLKAVGTHGHGLGLSIVARIVEKMSGTVGVESEEGKGSLFYFTLPAYLNDS